MLGEESLCLIAKYKILISVNMVSQLAISGVYHIGDIRNTGLILYGMSCNRYLTI